MKNLIIVLLLPVFCFGQKKVYYNGDEPYKILKTMSKKDTLVMDGIYCVGDSCWANNGKIKKPKEDTLKSKWTDAIWATPANHTTLFTISRRDTVACIFLVCDTLKRPSDIVGYDETTPIVWWKSGFVVYEMQYGQIPCGDILSSNAIATYCQGWYRSKLVTYLDRRKKPLDSWIVVWQVKEIN